MNNTIFQKFPITSEEYAELDKRFGDLCNFAGWQLLRKNIKNNHTDELEDITQQLRMALIRAGCYYKRQVYIEDCLELCKKYSKKSPFISKVVKELEYLWANRTKHGANKQKFGEHQEKMLDYIVGRCVPKDKRPDPKRPLIIDSKFSTYCKAIAWNSQKSLGRKITRERSIRTGQVSLSEYDYMGAEK